ncbi:hypothetical protein BT63DRAFT_411806 [Microthyrium microscopicum]|uniref:Uncharacterized protein n=1 Tax=Microthyrium microscopicum TaxID=703497 RepID=A0A6A6UGY0_9PEZI|nr:hypothetical protein BT63DRAFT_411806 [Microthyrium microscopicum]
MAVDLVKRNFSRTWFSKPNGTDRSEKPDAYEIVQGPTQIEILNQLIALARSGRLGLSVKQQQCTLTNFNKTVALRHLIGSIVTSGLLTRHPSAANGAVLTGFLLSTKTLNTQPPGLILARSDSNQRFQNLPNGYLVQATQGDIHHDFFLSGNLELNVLDYTFPVKDSSTVGERVGLPVITGVPAPNDTNTLLKALSKRKKLVDQPSAKHWP